MAERQTLSILAWNESKLFSVLDRPHSIRALALYVVYKELPPEAYSYAEEYNTLMGPVLRMVEDGTFEDLYRRRNPKIAAQSEKLDRRGEDI